MEIGIIGAGGMGRTIAKIVARSGLRVKLVDIDRRALLLAVELIHKELNKRVSSGEMTNYEKDILLQNITTTDDYNELKQSNLIMEFLPEKLEEKKKAVKELDRINAAAVIATGTSSLSVSKIAMAAKKPQRVIGIHFTHKPEDIGVAEVVTGRKTSPATIKKAQEFCMHLKQEVVMANDTPGFILNRFVMQMINDAAFMVEKKQATKESIDTALKVGLGMPLGPLELADEIGLDYVHEVLSNLHTALKDKKLKPAPTITKLVRAKKFGKKSEEGFYKY